jgi:hypothetical protein
VEYKGLRYTIRTRIERDQWSVAIHPAGLEMKGRVVIGSRSDAELRARAMINDWLKKHHAAVVASDTKKEPQAGLMPALNSIAALTDLRNRQHGDVGPPSARPTRTVSFAKL